MDTDLKKLERKAFLTFFHDGLWDICLGLFIVGWGAGILTDHAYLAGTLFITLYFIVYGLKKWLTYPRIGYIKLGSRQEKIRVRLGIVLGIVAMAGILLGVAFISDERPRWLTDYFPLLFTGVLALIVGGVASWLGVRRFVFYAVLIFAGGAVHQWTPVEWSYTFLVSGGIITLSGLMILIRFLHDNPKTAAEGPYAGE